MYRNDPLAIGRQEAGTQYLRYADVGTVALVVMVPAILISDDQFNSMFGEGAAKIAYFVGMLCALALFIVLMTLFKKSLRDEYIEGLWNAGTAAGFVAGVIYTYGASFVAGATADYAKATGKTVPHWYELLTGHGITVAIFAFFIAFQIKRWRTR